MLDFETWYNENEDELYIKAAETGADREYDYDAEVFAEAQYEQYLNIQEALMSCLNCGRIEEHSDICYPFDDNECECDNYPDMDYPDNYFNDYPDDPDMDYYDESYDPSENFSD